MRCGHFWYVRIECEGKCRELYSACICKTACSFIEMCGSISNHGLVNYKYSVMEDDIIRGTSHFSVAIVIS